MTQTALAEQPRSVTRAAQLRREAALCERGRIVNVPVLDVVLRMLGWSRTRLAGEIGMDRTHVNLVINGSKPATAEFRWLVSKALPQAEPEELFVAPTGAAAPAVDGDGEAA